MLSCSKFANQAVICVGGLIFSGWKHGRVAVLESLNPIQRCHESLL